MKSSIFQVKVQELRRIVIPKPICEALNIERGSRVEIAIRKVDRVKANNDGH